MAEEKKYEITISDLSAYIGAAAFEILPEDAKEEDVDKYAKVNWIDRAVGYIGKERAAELRAKDEPVKNILYAHFVMDDNLSLSEKIKERYRNTYRGVFYKRYILGLWAMAEGVIYDMFDNEKHVEDPNAYISLI